MISIPIPMISIPIPMTSIPIPMNDVPPSLRQVKSASGETLKLLSERMTLNYIGQQALKLSFEQKSPKVHSESLDWLASAIKEFGFL